MWQHIFWFGQYRSRYYSRGRSLSLHSSVHGGASARQVLMESLINVDKTLSAGINNAYLFQDRQQFRCIG
ncbi:hypothetical protein D3C75_1277300 [compost metagenome]